MSKIRKVNPETIKKALTVPCKVLAGYAPNIFVEYYTALVFAEQNCSEKKDNGILFEVLQFGLCSESRNEFVCRLQRKYTRAY